MGTQLGDDGVVVRARGLAAFARVLRTDAGWDVLEAAWRDAVATDVVGATAAMLGAVMCYAAALHHDPDRADRYVAETVAFCRDHDIYSFGGIAAGVEALVALHRGQWERARACAEDVLTSPGYPCIRLCRDLPWLSFTPAAASGQSPPCWMKSSPVAR